MAARSDHVIHLDLPTWLQIAEEAIRHLPPAVVRKIKQDPVRLVAEVEALSQNAFDHFLLALSLTEKFVENTIQEAKDNQVAIQRVSKLLDEKIEFLSRCRSLEPVSISKQIHEFSCARLTLHQLVVKEVETEDRWRKIVPKANTSHDPILEKYLHDLMLTYSRLTQIAPSNLKLSSTKGPRTYLMNFLIAMTKPIPRFAELEEGRLAKRLHHLARQIINGPFKNLPKLP